MADLPSTARFSDRADDYVRYRSDDPPAVRGRLMSSPYAPQRGNPQHEPMLRALRELFDHCAENGTASLDGDTRIFASHVV